MAQVRSSRRTGIATLRWVVLLAIKQESADYDGGVLEWEVPVIGEVVSETERPAQEFYNALRDERIPVGRRLGVYVRQWLPLPAGCVEVFPDE